MTPLRWPRDRVVASAAIFAVFATALALFGGRYVPYIDWSNHLGLIAILAHGDASGASEYFVRSWMPTPYLLFYVLSALLGQLVPVDVAARGVLSLSAALWVFGAAHLAESTGRSPRLALLAPLGVFSVSLGWGFGSFVLASPLLFFALGSTERVLAADARPPRGELVRVKRRRILELGAILGLLYLGHALVFLCAALLIAFRGITVAAHRAHRRFLIDGLYTLAPISDLFLAAVPAMVLALPAVVSYVRHPWQEAGAVFALEFPPLVERLHGLGGNLLERGSPDHWWVMRAAAGVFLVLLAGAIARARDPDPPRTLGLETYAALLTALYFFGPMTLGGVWFVYPRYAVLAGVAVSLLPRVELRSWASAGLLAASLALVGSNALLNRRHIREFSEWARPFDRVRALIPRGARVLPLTVVGGDDLANRSPALGSLYFYLLVDGARYVPFLFNNRGHPVYWREDARHPRAPFWRSPDSYDPRVHGIDYDYLVLRGEGIIQRTERAGLHELVENVEGWAVFRTKTPPP